MGVTRRVAESRVISLLRHTLATISRLVERNLVLPVADLQISSGKFVVPECGKSLLASGRRFSFKTAKKLESTANEIRKLIQENQKKLVKFALGETEMPNQTPVQMHDSCEDASGELVDKKHSSRYLLERLSMIENLTRSDCSDGILPSMELVDLTRAVLSLLRAEDVRDADIGVTEEGEIDLNWCKPTISCTLCETGLEIDELDSAGLLSTKTVDFAEVVDVAQFVADH